MKRNFNFFEESPILFELLRSEGESWRGYSRITMNKIQATLITNQITTASSEAHTLLQKSEFGEKHLNKISYSPEETLYLLQTKKLDLQDFRNKPLTESEALKKFTTKDKNFFPKYLVYKDLREKGLIPKTALKFGADFRIYDKKNSHSKWLCIIQDENSKINIKDFAAKNRVAHSTKKKILLSVVDSENKVTYYETSWTQP